MEYVWIAVVAALTFGVCFLLDKLFSKLFHSRQQHTSGNSVKLRKRIATFGLLVGLLGLLCVVFYWGSHPVIFWSGWILLLMAVCMLVYYLSFGIYYDEEGFVYSRFGKKSQLYTYGRIVSQQLYNSYGNILIELHMTDGRSVQLQAGMAGVYPFLDKAFSAWCAQKGIREED